MNNENLLGKVEKTLGEEVQVQVKNQEIGLDIRKTLEKQFARFRNQSTEEGVWRHGNSNYKLNS